MVQPRVWERVEQLYFRQSSLIRADGLSSRIVFSIAFSGFVCFSLFCNSYYFLNLIFTGEF